MEGWAVRALMVTTVV